MNIVIDENIPYAHEALSSLGEVRLLSGRAIVNEELRQADALIVRSITRVDRELLDGTPVRFVGTATNGLDHIDLEYLRSAGIAFSDIAGANAESVAEYVLAALMKLRSRGVISFQGQRVGVVGAGNIGARVAEDVGALGLTVVAYDPPRGAHDPSFVSASLDELYDCDIITLHVPYIAGGEHPTHHFIDGAFLARLRPGAILLNTARGGVADSAALVAAVASGALGGLVLDVWEGEPSVPVELIESAELATPHIAGYSADAKGKGTEAMAHALAEFIGVPNDWSVRKVLPEREGLIAIPARLDRLDALATAVRSAYDIVDDDGALRSLLALNDQERRLGFDRLRKNYPRRREFAAYGIETDDREIAEFLGRFGFDVKGEGR